MTQQPPLPEQGQGQKRSGPVRDLGFLAGLANEAKLVFRLWGDPRVSWKYKLLPLGALVYLISPIDFAVGGLDDAAAMLLLFSIFIEVCPPEVVIEHRQHIEKEAKIRRGETVKPEKKPRTRRKKPSPNDVVIDAEARDPDEQPDVTIIEPQGPDDA